MDLADTVAVWLHALASVVALGYYGILARIVLPALGRELDGSVLGRAVVRVERTALPIVIVAVIVFTASGIYLLLVDDDFAGLGRFTESTWATLMLAKHVVVGLMVVGGVLVHVLVEQLTEVDRSDADRRSVLRQARLAAEAMTALGAIVLLLTAAAQTA